MMLLQFTNRLLENLAGAEFKHVGVSEDTKLSAKAVHHLQLRKQGADQQVSEVRSRPASPALGVDP